jgi:hypothetical protein
MPSCIYVIFRKKLFKDYAFLYFNNKASVENKVKELGKKYYYKSVYHSLDDTPNLFYTKTMKDGTEVKVNIENIPTL